MCSGTHVRDVVITSPKEVALPGSGPIDGVAFGPEWVVAAKQVRQIPQLSIHL
jgi:hypothetical protein